MKNLKTIENNVKMILKKNEDARNDDMVLYLALCNLCLKDAEIMTQHKSSVCRALRASAGHAASYRHGIQSLRGAAPYRNCGRLAKRHIGSMRKSKGDAYGK